MALTGPTVTGYQGFWSLTGDFNPYAMVPDKNGNKGRSPTEAGVARLMIRNQHRDVSAALIALIGAASGSNVTKTYSREQSPTGPDQATPVVTAIGALGGTIPIETVTVLNRNTTAADVAYLKDIFDGDLLERTLTYPTVLGSGGGGKVGTF